MGIQERKEREKELRRSNIIDAAERVFFEKGFDARVDDVASEAELSKGTIYLYFPSKEDIHFAIAMRGLYLLDEKLREAYDKTKSITENLPIIGETYLQFTKTHENYFKVIMLLDSSSMDKISSVEKSKLLQAGSPLVFFAELLSQGQEEGFIRNDINANELALMLWLQINGVLEFTILRRNFLEMLNINPKNMIKNQFQVLLNGILK